MAEIRRDVDSVIAHLPGVRKAVRTAADPIASKARGRLASHRDTGEHSVELVRGVVDTHVDLVGPAALTLETGRSGGIDRSGRRKGPMEPLNILRGAL